MNFCADYLRASIIFSFIFISVALLPHPQSLLAASPTASTPTHITVYKSATCDCCQRWVDYLEKNGFKVVTKTTTQMSEIKTKYKVPAAVQACHTAVIGDYVIEGHVPADAIKKLLSEKPDVAGIAVPGMPIGSPGMEGDEPEGYDVITFNAKGKVKIFGHYN